MSNISEYLKTLNRRNKADDIPGTVQTYLDELCPSCGKKLRLMKPCCSSKFGTKECKACGYKIVLGPIAGDSRRSVGGVVEESRTASGD